MERRPLRKLDTPDVQEWIGSYENRVRPLLFTPCKPFIDFPDGFRPENLHLQADGASCRLDLSYGRLQIGQSVRVYEKGDALSMRYELVEKLQPLLRQFVGQHIDPSEITSGARETGDETEPGRIVANQKYDRNGRGDGLSRECRGRAAGGDGGSIWRCPLYPPKRTSNAWLRCLLSARSDQTHRSKG
jgi:hypothetical protein